MTLSNYHKISLALGVIAAQAGGLQLWARECRQPPGAGKQQGQVSTQRSAALPTCFFEPREPRLGLLTPTAVTQ